MSLKVLAAIGQASYGELLRISLEREGLVEMDLVNDGSSALTRFSKDRYGLLLLDGEIKDQPISALIQNLHFQSALIRVIVILSEKNDSSDIKKLPGVDSVFIKPFHIQELVRRVNQIAREVNSRSINELKDQTDLDIQVDTSWIDDRDAIQENLFRLAFRSPAQAVMVFYDNKVWVQASRLENYLSQKVIDQFVQAWDKKSSMDLIRFFKDKGGINTWMLYATSLVKQYSLVMVFPGRSLLHEVRGEVIRMANGLCDSSLYDIQRKEEADFLRAVKEESEKKERSTQKIQTGSAAKKKTGGLKKKTGRIIRFSLLPRDQSSFLKGDLADSLNIWIPQICDSQQWELVELEVLPEKLQFSLALFPDQQIEKIASYMRKKTTEMVFKLFPLQKIHGDFWNEEVLTVDVEKELPTFLTSQDSEENEIEKQEKG